MIEKSYCCEKTSQRPAWTHNMRSVSFFLYKDIFKILFSLHRTILQTTRNVDHVRFNLTLVRQWVFSFASTLFDYQSLCIQRWNSCKCWRYYSGSNRYWAIYHRLSSMPSTWSTPSISSLYTYLFQWFEASIRGMSFFLSLYHRS